MRRSSRHALLMVPIWILALSRIAPAEEAAATTRKTTAPQEGEIARRVGFVAGAKVLPKETFVALKGNARLGPAKLCAPWVVQSVDGLSLKITQPAQVLVSVDEVVPVNEAVAYFAGVIARDRRNEIALNLLSIAHREAGNLDAAIEDANCAIACRPGYATALINRASARLKKLEINAALADYDEAIRRDPRLPDAYAMRGFVMLHIKKELGKALADFDEAIRLDPRYSLALVNRAALRLIRGEPDLAIADATNAILVAPDDASPFSIRATAWGSKANWELALADFNEAIRIQPTKFNFYVSRGTVWRMLDKFDLAIGDFATAISLAPDELGGYQGLLEVLLDNENVKYRDFKRAVEVGRRACEVTQWKNPDCLATLAAACFETGQAAEAVNYQKQALALTPLNHEKTQRRHDALKRYQEALDTASKR